LLDANPFGGATTLVLPIVRATEAAEAANFAPRPCGLGNLSAGA